MAKYLLVLSFILISSPSYSEDTKLANIASWSTVLTNIALDTAHSYRSIDKKEAFTKQSLRIGITVLSSEVIKRIVHKVRPDGSDDRSFWSEHSALAATSQSWNFYIGGSLTFGTMAGRVEAKRHFPVDVAVGATVGTLIERLIH